MRALGVDYGQRRIGLALSDPTGLLARPWKTIPRLGGAAKTATSLASEIARLHAEDDGLVVVVIGLPRRLNGSDTGLTAEVERLASSLRHRISVPVVLQDERLTSREAEVLKLVVAGHRTNEIAGILQISRKTVETHRAAIMRKLQLHRLADVVRFALQHNLCA